MRHCRRRMSGAVVLFLFGLGMGLSSVVFAQRDFSKVEIKTVHVAGKVYMLIGAGGNIGVSVGEDGILIVDDQFAELSGKIRTALETLAPGKLKFILNTHWHGDHTGGNPVFGKEATIIAHANVRKRVSTEQHIFGRTVPPLPPEGWPVITYEHSVSVHFNGEEIKAIHFPHGHTDGDSVIFFTKSNVVHMVDDFFADQFPFVDLDSGGSVQGLIRNVERLLTLIPEDAKIIPGHGKLSTVQDLKRYLTMLKETSEIVRQRMREGKSLEAIKAEGLPEQWTRWGSGFITTERWVEIVYRSFKEAKGRR